MPRLEARYCPPGQPAFVIWVRPVPFRDGPWTLGQTETISNPEERSDWGLNHPDVPDAHQRGVSRNHLTLRWDAANGQLELTHRRIPKPPANTARSLDGRRLPDQFRLRPGEGLRITDFFQFRLLEDDDGGGSDSVIAIDFPARHDPAAAPFLDPEKTLGAVREVVLAGDLERDEAGFARVVARTLRQAVPAAGATAVIRVPADGPPEVFAVDPPGGVVEFSAASAAAVIAANRGRTSCHVDKMGRGGAADTLREHTDWGIYVPVEGAPLVVYACGTFCDRHITGRSALRSDGVLARAREAVQVLAEVYATLRRVRWQGDQIETLREFVPVPVRVLVDRLDRADLPPAMDPKVRDATILFCDIRGFTPLTEENRDHLEDYWRQVLQEALGLMATAVDANSGVIGSFLGDAVMGFWGWPDDDPYQHSRAVAAAADIRRGFDRARERDPRGVGRLSYGVGIASGRTLVGRLGTNNQRTTGVVGPAVNLAARLEGLTKSSAFGVSVLLDAVTRAGLRDGDVTQRLGRVLPVGVTRPVEVFELVALAREVRPDAKVTRPRQMYAAGLEAFETGDWAAATAALDRIRCRPGEPPLYRPADFLAELVAGRPAPPAGWPRTPDGACAIVMESK